MSIRTRFFGESPMCLTFDRPTFLHSLIISYMVIVCECLPFWRNQDHYPHAAPNQDQHPRCALAGPDGGLSPGSLSAPHTRDHVSAVSPGRVPAVSQRVLASLARQRLSETKSSLDRLREVEAGVAVRLVILRKPLFSDADAAPDALGDARLAGHLEVHPREHGAVGAMDGHRLYALAQHVLERSRLELRRRGRHRVAVHAVALPNDRHARVGDGADVAGQVLLDLADAVPRDEDELALELFRVEDLHERFQLGGFHRRPHLAANRVLEPAEVFDVPTE
mmetsp:Transcript_27341/g.63888  ORF Transcript_27341/g.63888 Transcript_27341/m.63888 type:complete len:279 (-) Transcript_27341:361-1197(-)